MIGLRITDGTTTIDLQASPWFVLEYSPKTGRLGELVTDSIKVGYGRDSNAQVTNARAALNSITRLLAKSNPFDNGRFQRSVWLEFSIDYALTGSTEPYWRSPIVDSVMPSGEDALLDTDLWNKTIVYTLEVTRQGWFEGVETELALATRVNAKVTGGVTIYNADYATTDGNFVVIAGADISGELDAPCRLEIGNTVEASGSINQIHYGAIRGYGGNGAGWGSNPVTLKCHDATSANFSVTGSTTVSAGVSRTWTGLTGSAPNILCEWLLPTDYLEQFDGRTVKPILRLISGGNAGLQFRLRLMYGGAALPGIMELLDRGWSDYIVNGVAQLSLPMNSVEVPPWLRGEMGASFNMSPISARLEGRYTPGGSWSALVLGDLQMTPAQDGFRSWTTRGYAAGIGWQFWDDGINETAYTRDGGDYRVGTYQLSGKRIKLRPNIENRIWFAHSLTNATVAKDRRLALKMFYRPRRTTL